ESRSQISRARNQRTDIVQAETILAFLDKPLQARMVDSAGATARFLGDLCCAALRIGHGRDLLGTDAGQRSRQRTPDEGEFPLGSRSGGGMIREEAADPIEESPQQRADLVENRWLDEVIRLHLDTVEDDDLRRRCAGVADLERDGRASLFAADLDGWPLENDFILEGAGVINATIEVHAAWNDNRSEERRVGKEG